jgi:nitroreductase
MTSPRTSSGIPTPSTPVSVAHALIAAAAMAPSILNTQPWSFDIHDRAIDLYVDGDRAQLQRVDPFGRQLTVSCGAALLNMRVTAAHLGRAIEVDLLPDAAKPTLLATIELGSRIPIRGLDVPLQPAIRRRHTHRRAFAPRPVPGVILRELVEAAHHEQAALVALSRGDRDWLLDLVALSEAALTADPSYDDDLAPWTDSNPRRRDGIPPSSFGTTSLSGSPPMRDFARAHPQPPVRRERYSVDPCIALLSTAQDTPLAWLQAGQALQRVLLLATLRGLAASFLNQPLETEEIRGELFQFGHPQMILRLGYARAEVATPRRPVTDVIRHES